MRKFLEALMPPLIAAAVILVAIYIGYQIGEWVYWQAVLTGLLTR